MASESSGSKRAVQTDAEAAFSAVKARSNLFQIRLAEVIQARDTGFVRLEAKIVKGRVTHVSVALLEGSGSQE